MAQLKPRPRPIATPTAKQDGRRERGDRTIDAIVLAAGDLIAERGLADTTLQQIADLAGVSKGAVTNHFGNKELIAEQVLFRGFVTMGDSEDDDRTQHPQKVIDAAISLSVLTHQVPLILAANRLATGHEKDPFFGRQQRYYIEVITQVLEDAKAAGQLLPGVDCKVTAKLWVLGYTGIETLARARPETLPQEIDDMNLAVCRGIVTPETMGRLVFGIQRGIDLAEHNPLLHEARARAAARRAG